LKQIKMKENKKAIKEKGKGRREKRKEERT
jgi:hypothetical protein